MSRTLTGGEKSAYEKVIAGVRHAEEACVELGHHLSDARWMQMAILMAELQNKVRELRTARSANAEVARLIS